MGRHFAPLSVLLAGLFAVAASAQKSPEEAKAALTAGNERFVAGTSIPQPLGPGARRTLARGQSPFAIVLCCADSRVPPEHVFNTGLGELFVVRVAGNCVDAETIASIEYAAEHLGSQLLVVLGHERCGAIAAASTLLQQANAGKPVAAESPALQTLLDNLEPAVRRAAAQNLGGRELCDRAEEENAQGMAVECLRRSSVLQKLQKIGRFQVQPARYHLESGQVEWLPPRPLPVASEVAQTPAVHTAPSMAPHVALRLLQAGHRRFLGDGKATGDISSDRRKALGQGQQPFAIVVTCADSRLAPEHIFDAGLGELFVVRIAGNVITDDILASVEYAAAHTGAPLLLVLGHSACGAVTAAAEHANDPHLSDNLRALVERLQPAVEMARATGPQEQLVARAVRANAQRFVVQARSKSAILRELEHEGRFTMLSAVYDLATGDIEWLKDAGPAHEPAAAPAGETHGHGAADGHGEASHGTPAPTAPAHGEHGDAHAAPDHGAQSGHGDHSSHGAAADHAQPAPGDGAAGHELDWAAGDGHGDHAHGAESHSDAAHATAAHADGHTEAPAKSTGTSSPVLVLGITGIVSLVAAAMIALRGRA